MGWGSEKRREDRQRDENGWLRFYTKFCAFWFFPDQKEKDPCTTQPGKIQDLVPLAAAIIVAFVVIV